MFTKARIKLTSFYLVIIMAVSLLFSAVIFRSVSADLNMRFNAIERRFEGIDVVRHMKIHELLLEDLATAQKSLLLILLYTDGFIFVVSAVAGFVLAGKTLKPIEDAMEEQKRFIADASHEFKTPLTAIKTNIEVNLRDKKLTLKQAKKVMKQNLEEVNKMRDLSSGLLTMARLTQYEDIQKTEVDIAKLTKSIYKNMQVLADANKIKLSLKTEKSVILADYDSIEKLIKILLDNAIKYTDKGSVGLSVKPTQNKKHIEIKIVDTGIGISNVDLPCIYDRFYRADSSRSSNSNLPIGRQGFGLGLCLAKQIVESHNGEISVKSKVGKGTTFVVKLPV